MKPYSLNFYMLADSQFFFINRVSYSWISRDQRQMKPCTTIFCILAVCITELVILGLTEIRDR